ncbi:MAG: hypothetical protein K0S09_2026 [Sphingobacteriaceae bacterium]|jgi:hypothetical protein|nr:hypothetical protein [Sphingobacteriaceae bacterium]
MAEISTPIKNELCTQNLSGGCQEEERLSEDEQRFFSFLKGGLDKLSKSPRNSAVDNILNYSKSL